MRLVYASSLNRWPAPCRSRQGQLQHRALRRLHDENDGTGLVHRERFGNGHGWHPPLPTGCRVHCSSHPTDASPDTAGTIWRVPHTRAAPGPAPPLATDRNSLRSGRVTFGQLQSEHAIFIRGLNLCLIYDDGQSEGALEGAIAASFPLILSSLDSRLACALPAQPEGVLVELALTASVETPGSSTSRTSASAVS